MRGDNRKPFVQKDAAIRIGVKYCGGCCPRFDRVALVNKLRGALNDEIIFLSKDSPSLDAVLIVAGCPAACVDIDPFEGTPVITISSPEDADAFIQKFKRKQDKWSG